MSEEKNLHTALDIKNPPLKSNQFKGWSLSIFPKYYQCARCNKYSQIVRSWNMILFDQTKQRCNHCHCLTILDPFVGQT